MALNLPFKTVNFKIDTLQSINVAGEVFDGHRPWESISVQSRQSVPTEVPEVLLCWGSISISSVILGPHVIFKHVY